MLTTPKQIAQCFRQSVSFNFQKETIHSYYQIENAYDDFYTLVDREAFCALLNDFLGGDNQLVDVFVDVFDAELGLHCFANQNACNSPRSRISYFLNQPKYQYHKNNIAKVYLAFNTWLVFFGYGEISPEWARCPFCGTATKNGTCTNKFCKKTSAECSAAAAELALLLADEQAGKATPTPPYWDMIADGSEFFIEYKQAISTFKAGRRNQEALRAQEKIEGEIREAEAELNQIAALLQIEAEKTSPDFDLLLTMLANSQKIKNASKYNDAEFAKKIKNLKAQITKKKKEHEKAVTDAQKLRSFQQAVQSFLANYSIIEEEMEAQSIGLAELKEIFEETNQLFSKIVAGLKLGFIIEAQQTLDVVNKYDNERRAEAAAFIAEREHQAMLLQKQKELLTKVNLILNDFNGAMPKDNKSAQIAKRFAKEIESNTRYDDYRVERPTQYKEIVNPIRVELAELIKKENEQKLIEFKIQAKNFIVDLDLAKAEDLRASVFRERLTTLKTNNFFDSIRTNGEYVRYVNIIAEKIGVLEKAEKAYNEEQERKRKLKLKKRKRRRRFLLVSSIILLVMMATTFLLELAGVLPVKLTLGASSQQIVGEIYGDAITVTSGTGADKNLVIAKEHRKPWNFSAKPVKAIGVEAFANSQTLETVSLPSSIEKIEEKAFSSCPSLRRIALASAIPPAIAEDAFDGSNVAFYVPEDSYDAYLQHEQWAKYANNIFPDYHGNDLEYGTIILENNGGSGAEDIAKHKLNTLCEDLPTPEKYGHAFLGWTYYVNGESKRFDPAQTLVTESVKLYAQWEEGHYTLAFDCQGGKTDTPEKAVKYNAQYGKLPTPTRDGYTFAGWYVNGKAIDAKSIVNVSSDVTASAKWTANTYTVTFDYAGGAPSTTEKSGVFDGAYGDLPTSSRIGYVFSGWYYVDTKIEATSLVKVASNHTLKAKWTPITYSISCDLNGGMGTTQVEYRYDEEITFHAPYKEGYTFLYWEIDGKQYRVGDTALNLSSQEGDVLNAIAQWEVTRYTITYALNGGVNNAGNIHNEYTIESDTIPLLAPTRTGYEFVAWHEDTLMGKLCSAIEKNSTGNKVFYAEWSANDNVLHFDANGGDGTMADMSIQSGETCQLLYNTFTRTGYSFLGWNTSADASTGVAYANGDVFTMSTRAEETLYAVWSLHTYAISYELNGGSNHSLNPNAYTVESPKIQLHSPTKAGYRFVAWCKDSSLTTECSEIEAGNVGERTFYAKWEANLNVVYFEPNGGEGTTQQKTGRTGESIILLGNVFSKEGCRFAGWSTSVGGSSQYGGGVSYVVGTEEVQRLYAVWSQEAFTISYNLNGGTNASVNPSGYNSFEGVATLYPATRTGYTFDGWYTESGYTNKIEKIEVGSETDYDLYAKWTANEYEVTFRYNGGNGTVTSRTVTFGNPYKTLPTASRTGYIFKGWYYGETRITENSVVALDFDHKLEAKWELGRYVVSYNLNGGTGTNVAKTLVYGESYGELPTPTRANHDFLGWYYEGGKIESDTQMLLEKDHTLIAQWIAKYAVHINENHVDVKVIRNDTKAEVTSGTLIPEGTSLTISCEAHDGYKNADCTYNGETICMPSNDLTIDSSADKKSSCLAKGTPILLADGSTAAIETLRVGDAILTYDHLTGRFVESKIGFTYYDFDLVEVITLRFSNGEALKLVNTGHGLFDCTLGRYVLITPSDAQAYVGHQFAYVEMVNGGWKTSVVELTGVVVTTELIERYDVVSENNLNHIAGGVLACSDTLVGVANIFDFDGLLWDTEQMEADIQTYGLYTYEEWADYVSYEDFVAFKGAYFKIAIGKGLLTEEELFSLIQDINTIW